MACQKMSPLSPFFAHVTVKAGVKKMHNVVSFSNMVQLVTNREKYNLQQID